MTRGSQSNSAKAMSDDATGRRGLGSVRIPGILTLAAVVILIAAVHFGQRVLIPLALAMLLSFLLAPLVARLRRWALPRVVAVLASVSLAALAILVVIVTVTLQALELADSLPQYRRNVEAKIESIRTVPGGRIDRLLKLIDSVGSNGAAETLMPAPDVQSTTFPDTAVASEQTAPKPLPVEVVEHALTPLDVLAAVVNPIITAGIVVILVIFILLAREDIRNRFVMLLGNRRGQMYVTTQVMDEAAARVSRYLLMQLVVAVSYGVPIGVGLAVIGVPNAALWGLLAIALRFVPYIGPWVAAGFPLAMAFAVDPGWSMVLWTACLFVVVELILNNVIEPWLYGSSAGMSPLGILLATVFWASLWGPVGLIVATPLTACLVALGRYIPGLNVLTLLLGNAPPLPLHVRIYQRVLALDPDEPDDLAREYLKGHSLEEFYGDLLVPVLTLIESERHDNDEFGQSHYEMVLAQVQGLVEDFADHPEYNADSSTGIETANARDVDATGQLDEESTEAYCMPAHSPSDELVALMVAVLLRRRGIAAAALSGQLLASERIERLERTPAPIVCVCAVPPSAVIHARHIVKRIERTNADAQVIVTICDSRTKVDELQKRLATRPSITVVTTLQQAVEHLKAVAPRGTAPALR